MRDEKFKPVLCLDFDGVINSYSSGWQGIDVINDKPVPGSQEFVISALEQFRIAIFSSRSEKSEGIKAIQDWLKRWKFPVEELEFPTSKPPAFLTIDDRGWQFSGSFPEVETLLNFKPWWKKEEKETVAITE